MRLLYISTPSFADCDFPLIKTMQQKGIDVTYLILLKPFSLRSTLFDIKEQIPLNDIIPATDYREMKIYENYMDMSKVYIANRTSKKDSSLKALCLDIKILNFIRKGNYDIIHTDTFLNMWDSLIYRFYKDRMVLTVHDPFPHTGESSSRNDSVRRNMIGTIKHFVLLNNRQKHAFCNMYRLADEQVFINRLGIYDNIRMFVKEDIKETKNNVLFFGRISPYKGVECLCQAMVKVRESIPDATLTIAGGGKIYFDIEPFRQLPWIDVRNHYVGMDELSTLLQQCSVSVCPYTDATQSGVIMTSYSLGKPVIATRVGGLMDMVDDGCSGCLVPPKDTDALADAIVAFLADRQTMTNMSEYIKSQYNYGERSWDKIVDGYLQMYKVVFN